jgi:hypothetical protein
MRHSRLLKHVNEPTLLTSFLLCYAINANKQKLYKKKGEDQWDYIKKAVIAASMDTKIETGKNARWRPG